MTRAQLRKAGVKVPRAVDPVRSAKVKAAKAGARERASKFRLLCQQSGLPMPTLEYRFAQDAMQRMWSADFAWEEHRVALECDGGLYTGGGHVRGRHVEDTHDKQNAYAVLGWRVLYCTPKKLNTEATIALVRHTLTP